MRRFRNTRQVTIKREIVVKQNKFSLSYRDLEKPCDIPRLTRRKSCNCAEFGVMSNFQFRYQNIQPILVTKQSIMEKEMKDRKRRQTSILEDTAMQQFRRGMQEFSKCKTVIQTFQMLRAQRPGVETLMQEFLKNSSRSGKRRRQSCYCTQCGKLGEFERKHLNEPYFNKFNMQLERKTSSRISKYKKILKSHIQQENLKKSYITENKSPLSKFKSVSRTVRLLLEQSSTKINQYNQRYSAFPSQRVKTEPSQQYSPRSFKLYPIKTPTAKQRLHGATSVYKTILNPPKDSFRTLASIYR